MSSPSDPHRIFDRTAVRLHRDRAARHVDAVRDLLESAADRLLDRLDDITRRFTRALDIGGRGVIAPRLAARGMQVISCDLSARMAARAGGLPVVADEEFLPFADGAFDLVIAALSLHWVNDLPGTLLQIRRTLSPDGLFIAALPGLGTLHFFDAAAPIVTAESLDMDIVYRASRYGKGNDYLNCPMNKAQYEVFCAALLTAETADVHDFDGSQVFEGCMPIEVMAARGPMAIAFGPLKPVGLTDPRTGRGAYAVVQLRQDDAAGTLYNLVGFQTRLKFGEQRRVFRMIPGLQQAEFARYGVMHRNTFLHAPGVLDSTYQMIARPGLYFAGQMTGVEGYVESASSGLVAGLSLARQLSGLPPVDFTRRTAIGALAHYIATPNSAFQPMNVNFGIIEDAGKRIRNKQERYAFIANRAIDTIEAIRSNPLAADFEREK